jgi:hypothetical protein
MSYGTPDVCLRSGAAAIPAPDTSSPVIASGEVRTNVGGSRMRGVTGPGVLRIQLAQCEVRLFLRIHYHQASDLYSTYSDKDFRLGLNAAQTTLGAVAELTGVRWRVPSRSETSLWVSIWDRSPQSRCPGSVVNLGE